MRIRLNNVLFILGMILSSSMAQAEERGLTFGIVPQHASLILAKKWSPVLAYLSRVSGVKLTFATARDIPTFEKRLADGVYDIAYMNPYHYTVFSRSPGYRAFAKQKDKKIRGILVVRKDSNINDISQLAGRSIAFPAPAAFAASILPQAELKVRQIPFKPVYVSSHDSVYRGVARNVFAVGGGVIRTFTTTQIENRNDLRILWKTRGYTSHAFAAHKRVAPEQLQKILAAMLAANQDNAAYAMLKGINFKGFEQADDAHWNDVRKLDIRLLNALIEE